MTPTRRAISAILLLAVFSSSVEVLFGDRDAGAAVAVEAVASAEPLAGSTATTLMASPTDGHQPVEDCACLCACVCAGAQLVTFAPAAGFEPVIPGLDLPTTASERPNPFPAPRPRFRPPLG